MFYRKPSAILNFDDDKEKRCICVFNSIKRTDDNLMHIGDGNMLECDEYETYSKLDRHAYSHFIMCYVI